MKHRKDLEDFFRFLSSRGILLDAFQRRQLSRYLELIENWSTKQNLVSKRDIPYLVKRHFLPSVFIYTCLPKNIKGSVMDLGSGAGFPGVLINVLRPQIQLTLLDSSRKKILFLNEVCDELELGARVVCDRSENYLLEEKETYQVVVARAVARIRRLLELVSPGLLNGGRLITIKGIGYKEEIDEAGGRDLIYRVYKPSAAWLRYSNYLKDKYVIDVER